MFLKGFRDKSNQKFIKKLLNNKPPTVVANELQTIGVLLNFNEFNDFEAFRKLFKELELTSPKCRVAAFIEDEKEITSTWNTYFIPKNIGWNGKIESVDLETFINADFDVLISYYNQSRVELNLITVLSKAKFKIGLTNVDDRFYDLIINLKVDQFNIFKTELKKYLNILKLI